MGVRQSVGETYAFLKYAFPLTCKDLKTCFYVSAFEHIDAMYLFFEGNDVF